MAEKVRGKAVQIAVGENGAVYVLDDKGRLWYSHGSPVPSALHPYPLPEELDPEKRTYAY
jgi:hypothetical protein